jgi:hypothetical protein
VLQKGRQGSHFSTACGKRFGCPIYTGSLKGGAANPDVDILNVLKN